MNENPQLNEAVLNTWLQFEGIMRMTVVSGDLTHREFSICNMLANSQTALTATNLCERLSVEKSQMHRTLKRLEDKGLIVRERSRLDKRRVDVRLASDGLELYEDMHKRAIDYTDAVVKMLGSDIVRIREAFIDVINAFDKISLPTEKGLKQHGKNN